MFNKTSVSGKDAIFKLLANKTKCSRVGYHNKRNVNI